MNQTYFHIIALLCGATTSLSLSAQPLTLQACRQQALQHSERISRSETTVNKAEFSRKEAFAAYLPQLDASAKMLMHKDIDILDFDLQMRGTWLAGISLTQPIYAGGRIHAANRMARIGQEISLEQARQIRQEVIYDVDNTYYTLIAIHEKVKMLEAYRKQIAELHKNVSVLVNNELRTQADLLRIETRQSEVDYQLQRARNGEELCRLSLCRLIGADLDAPITAADTVMNVLPPADLSADIALRPELSILQQQVELRQQQVKQARAGMLPTLGLVLSYSYFDNLKFKGSMMLPSGRPITANQTLHSGSPTGLLSLSVPLFHWGAERARVNKAKADVQDANLQLQENRSLMSIQARKAIQNLTHGYLLVETARRTVSQANDNLHTQQSRYSAQLSTLSDLLDAQSQWQQAQSNLIEAITQQKINETDYLRVTGRL